jgi:predicted RNase H-like HicB family nuclease
VLTGMKPLREELNLQKDGFSLVWSPEAVALLRAALDRRHEQRSIAEAESYGEALQSLEVLAGTLLKLSGGVRKIHGLLSRKPAETAYLNTLPTQTHRLAAPVCVLLSADAKKGFQASLPELSLVTEGKTRAEALRRMQRRLWNLYQEVRAAPQQAAAEWTILQQLIVQQP